MASSSASSPCGRECASERKAILFHTLDYLNITTTTKPYDPELNLDYDSGGMYCKNLVLKDRKGQFYYVIIPIKSTVNLRKLKEIVKASGNLRFASQTDVQNSLNSEPGAINPFGVMFNKTTRIRIIFDDSLTAGPFLYFHPFLATEATAISYIDLVKFTEYYDHYIEVYDLFSDSHTVLPVPAHISSTKLKMFPECYGKWNWSHNNPRSHRWHIHRWKLVSMDCSLKNFRLRLPELPCIVLQGSQRSRNLWKGQEFGNIFSRAWKSPGFLSKVLEKSRSFFQLTKILYHEDLSWFSQYFYRACNLSKSIWFVSR